MSVPQDHEATLGPLRDVLGYRSFELLETTFLRTVDGSPGRITGGLGGDRSYRLGFENAQLIAGEERRTVRLSNLSFEYGGTGEQG